MLGFNPIAASPLGAIADGGLLADDIIAGVPTISATMAEEETFVIADITLGTPVVDSISVSTSYVMDVPDLTSTPTIGTIALISQQLLTCSEIITGAPVVDTATVTFFYDFTATEITSGAPVIDAASVEQTNNFTATEITTTPTVDSITFTQTHILTATEITAGTPTMPVRFLWDVQEITPETWTNISGTTETWTVVQDAA